MKLALIVQRYGPEVNGGAELQCREIAEHLSKYHEVEVITTCAIDYLTWKNEYPAGTGSINGVTVRRFPVDKPRNVEIFNRFSEKIFSHTHSVEDEITWMKLQGPYSSQLFQYIISNKESYDHFIFFTYLYCPTYFGLPAVKEKAILVPEAHDEPPIYLDIFKDLFNSPRAIIYNTEEERSFVNSRFDNGLIISDVAGIGIDAPPSASPESFRKTYGIEGNFIFYMGRIDESKGCKLLFEYFLRFISETCSDLKLVLAGKPVMKIPVHPNIMPIGFISDEDRFNGIMAAELMVIPSKYESLSMVLLENWICRKPSLVNGDCVVLKGHCIKSNGGLWYDSYDEFKECLNLLISDDLLRQKLGDNGEKYVRENYNWQTVIKKYRSILDPADNQ
jgi:glycosyltransferase involved in cell wall biosynthesis